MKKIKWLLILLIFAVVSCKKDSDTEFDPNDIDGDGVTNQQEVVDFTDPNDPCSLNLSSQYFPSTSTNWKMMDCDGDGVSNEQELEDQTGLLNANGSDLCDFIEENQDPTQVTDIWQSYDCDQDGVPNGIEFFNDNTDINDPCSLVITNQVQADVPDGWFLIDCDGDGRPNGEEIEANTDPLNPDSFPGSGTKIVRINENFYYSNGGTQYESYIPTEQGTAMYYTYDSMGNLTTVFFDDTTSENDDGTINFYYTGGQISQMTVTEDVVIRTVDVEHQGNTMLTYDSEAPLPTGFYNKKFTFNASGKVVTIDAFYNSGTRNRIEIFEYDADGDVLNSRSHNRGYDINTQSFFDLPEDQRNESLNTYTYQDNVLNPLYTASLNIYKNYLVHPGILARGILQFHGAFSVKFRRDVDLFTTSVNSVQYWNLAEIVQSNGYPVTIRTGGLGWDFGYDLYYEE